MNNWKRYKLGELIKINEKSIGNSFQYDTIEYIDTSSVTENVFDLPQILNLKDAPSRAKRIVKSNDTIISTVRPNLKHIGFLKNPKPNTIVSTGFAVLTPISINPQFLYFYLYQENITKYLSAIAETSTSTYPSFTSNLFETLDIEIPDLPTQTRIANFLSQFDDKVELNRQMNKNLEELAELKFRTLLKDKDKWRKGKLGELGEIVCGKTPSTAIKEYFGGDIPFIKIPDMHGNAFIIKSETTLTKLGSDTQKNKLLPPNSICVSCIATVGLVSLTTTYSQTNQQINSIIPYENEYRFYLYFLLKSMKPFLLNLGSGGTATYNINTGQFKNIDISIPNKEELIKFHNYTNNIFEKILFNMKQNEPLANYRDSILPKLISGAIEI
ncbi:MAG: restriction endonuclease subunit S [Limnohabitans sp.]|nr:restriction endonuclease subunit S [Limnohabitans sp.]